MKGSSAPLVLKVRIRAALQKVHDQVRLVEVGHAVKNRPAIESLVLNIRPGGEELPKDGPMFPGRCPIQGRHSHLVF